MKILCMALVLISSSAFADQLITTTYNYEGGIVGTRKLFATTGAHKSARNFCKSYGMRVEIDHYEYEKYFYHSGMYASLEATAFFVCK